MATLTEQRDALQAAYAKGILSVEYDGRRVTYQDMDAIGRAIDSLSAQIAAQSGTRVTTVLISTSKGL